MFSKEIQCATKLVLTADCNRYIGRGGGHTYLKCDNSLTDKYGSYRGEESRPLAVRSEYFFFHFFLNQLFENYSTGQLGLGQSVTKKCCVDEMVCLLKQTQFLGLLNIM